MNSHIVHLDIVRFFTPQVLIIKHQSHTPQEAFKIELKCTKGNLADNYN